MLQAGRNRFDHLPASRSEGRMDYLEGFLIGSIWSDTDYRSRRHFNAHIFLAAAMAAAFMVLVLFPERRDQLIVIGWPAVPALLFLLIVLTPVLSIFYRRLPFFIRPLALLVYAFKYLLLFYVLVHYFLPQVTFEKESILTLIFARMDGHIETALDVIAESGGILMTVAGVVVGGLWVIGEGLALIGILILIPLLAIIILKGLQYALDYMVRFLLDRQLAGVGPEAVSEIPWQGELDDGGEEALPVVPVPQKAAPEPMPERKEKPVRKRGPRQASHRKHSFKRQAARAGLLLAGLGAWLALFLQKVRARTLKAVRAVQAGIRSRRGKKTIRKSKVRSTHVRVKGREEKDTAEEEAGLGARLALFLKKVRARVLKAARSVQARIKNRRGKQAIRKSKIRLTHVRARDKGRQDIPKGETGGDAG